MVSRRMSLRAKRSVPDRSTFGQNRYGGALGLVEFIGDDRARPGEPGVGEDRLAGGDDQVEGKSWSVTGMVPSWRI